MRTRDKKIRVDLEFEKLIKDIARKRVVNGKDIKFKSSRRITLAMKRHPLFTEIEKDIVNANLED